MNWEDVGWLAPLVSDRIDEFTEKWWNAAFGPAHIVLDDYNVRDEDIAFCLGKLDNYNPDDYGQEHSPEELAATRELLQWLMAIPEDKRYGEG